MAESEFLCELCGSSFAHFAFQGFPLEENQEILIAKLAKELPQSSQRNSKSAATTPSR
jgi:hypothetical protein